MHGIVEKFIFRSATPPYVSSRAGHPNFMELVMKNTLVADSSFGTWPAPFSEYPTGRSARRDGAEAVRGESSPAVRVGVGLAVIAVLMTFVAVTSLLQFGAFNPRTDATADQRLVQVEVRGEAALPAARVVPPNSTEGDSK
jgi:hypothetical protein